MTSPTAGDLPAIIRSFPDLHDRVQKAIVRARLDAVSLLVQRRLASLRLPVSLLPEKLQTEFDEGQAIGVVPFVMDLHDRIFRRLIRPVLRAFMQTEFAPYGRMSCGVNEGTYNAEYHGKRRLLWLEFDLTVNVNELSSLRSDDPLIIMARNRVFLLFQHLVEAIQESPDCHKLIRRMAKVTQRRCFA